MTRLPHRIVIQTISRVDFEGGAQTTSWTTASTEWANVQRSRSINSTDETYNQEKKQQITKFDVVTRQDITLTNEQRLLFNGNILVVEGEGDPTYRGRMKITKCRLENT